MTNPPNRFDTNTPAAFDDGWDALREKTLARQKKLGVVPLLSREGEVAVGKRMAEGKRRVLSAVLSCHPAIISLLALPEKLRLTVTIPPMGPMGMPTAVPMDVDRLPPENGAERLRVTLPGGLTQRLWLQISDDKVYLQGFALLGLQQLNEGRGLELGHHHGAARHAGGRTLFPHSRGAGRPCISHARPCPAHGRTVTSPRASRDIIAQTGCQ